MSTCPLFHLSTRQLVYLSTCQLVNPSACQLVQHALQPFAQADSKHTRFQCCCPCACIQHFLFFCLVFSRKFNIVSALSAHQSLTLPQKINSREGWFWCKMCCYVNANKLDIYSNEPPFVPDFGLFSAKCTAICRKTQCVLMLNAR